MKFDAKEIGTRLAEFRKSLGHDQTKLSEILGVSKTTISNYERGKRNPDTEFLSRLHDHFDIDIHWLITGKGAPSAHNQRPYDEKTILRAMKAHEGQSYDQFSDFIDKLSKTYQFLYDQEAENQ